MAGGSSREGVRDEWGKGRKMMRGGLGGAEDELFPDFQPTEQAVQVIRSEDLGIRAYRLAAPMRVLRDSASRRGVPRATHHQLVHTPCERQPQRQVA
jgi:hypothetical protein